MTKKNPAPKSNTPENTGGTKKYKKPSIRTEELMTFGALCNGTTSGQRKQTTGAPNFCNSSKLLS